ncbi:MAG: hypothetical protein ABSG46_05145 [Candidatus Binataceae bacterium]|jgi:hypothetical protein
MIKAYGSFQANLAATISPALAHYVQSMAAAAIVFTAAEATPKSQAGAAK